MRRAGMALVVIVIGLSGCEDEDGGETGETPSQAEGQACGGLTGAACPVGFECVDDPSDDCDPQRGGADCIGICVKQERPAPMCGGIAGLSCPEGLECVEDPSDGCDPEHGGADCSGICMEP